MSAPRAGSRKASVHTAFHEGGANKALELGLELGLKAGTVKSWMNAWSKENGSGPVKIKHRNANEFNSKLVRVRELGFPRSRQGTIMEVGPQVSGVQWDDRVLRSDIRYVPNEWLIKLKPDGTDDEETMTKEQRKESKRLDALGKQP